MDDCWMENVGPLIQALKDMGIDPVEWAKEPDVSVFWFYSDPNNFLQTLLEEKIWIPEATQDDIHFALGYLQATGNLTNKSWAEQMAEGLKKEKDDG